MLIENLQRKDLDAIAKARGFERMCAAKEKGGLGYTQQQLAERLHLSQGQVANTLRLLKLPKAWQEKVISQEIPPTHARHLLVAADLPAVLEAIEDEMQYGGLGPVEEFSGVVADSMRGCSKPMTGKVFGRDFSGDVPVFKPTAEQLADLDVREVPDRWNSKKKERRAFNTKLWEKLQTAHEAECCKKRPSKAAGGKPVKSDNSKPLTASQKKAAEDYERKRRAELQKQFAKRLKAWRINWLRYLIYHAATYLPASDPFFTVLLLYFSSASAAWNHLTDSFDRERELLEAVRSATGRDSRGNPYGALQATAGDKVPLIVRQLVLEWIKFDPKKGPSEMFPSDRVEALAQDLKVEPAKVWRNELAGPLSEAYFQLHTKDQLQELADELGVYVEAGKGKEAMVKRLLNSGETKKKLPKELAGSRQKAAKKK